jgi:hypothetical protein
MNPEDTLPPQRRGEDPRISKMAEDIERAKAERKEMKNDIAENTALTVKVERDVTEMKATVSEVRDILTSFRVLAKVAKWFSYIAAGAGAGLALWKQIKGG